MRLYDNLTDYNKSIDEAKQLNGGYDKNVIFHCYWNGNLEKQHLLSIKSCYYFNVLNKSNKSIILWLENNVPNTINDKIREFAEIKEINIDTEKQGTFLSDKNIKKNLKLNIATSGKPFYSDFVRLVLLYKYGGCYFDLDVVFLRSFEPLFNKFENDICAYAWEYQPYPNNAILISLIPNSDNLKSIIEYIITRNKGFGFQQSQLTYDLPIDILVLPCAWFDPIFIENPTQRRNSKFFIENTNVKYNLNNFFSGAFCYHWHNFGSMNINNSSIMGQLDKNLNTKLLEGGYKKRKNKRKNKTLKKLNKYRNKTIKIGGTSIDLKDITIGILSWKSYETLKNTLESYKKNNLLNMVNSVIFFQEISDKDIAIANEYNIKYIGSETNIGIEGAIIELVNNITTKYFIFAENDFELVHNEHETREILEETIQLLENNDVKVVKLRDRRNPGEPLFSKTAFNPADKDFLWKLEVLHFVENPEEIFPTVYEIINYKHKWYKCSNKDNVWSNNIFITKTDWLKNEIVDIIKTSVNNTKDYMRLESIMRTNTRIQPYNVAAGIGLFTHNRLDR